MLDAKRLGLAGGILWGLSMFVLTILAIYTQYGAQWLTLIGDIYPGYTVSWGGTILGLIYGFIDGFLALFLFGWIYNKI